jgi:hypothetical protein
MTPEQVDAALKEGKFIARGHRLDNGEPIEGEVDISPGEGDDFKVWIDNIEIDPKKGYCQIILDDE